MFITVLTYEELDQVEVTAGCCRVERGPLLTVRGIHVRAKLNQHLNINQSINIGMQTKIIASKVLKKFSPGYAGIH